MSNHEKTNCIYCKKELPSQRRLLLHKEVKGALIVETPFFFCLNDTCIFLWMIEVANKSLKDTKLNDSFYNQSIETINNTILNNCCFTNLFDTQFIKIE